MRHAVATELGRRGVQPVIVSAVLGHASPSFTIAVYQHAWVEGPSEAAAALEAALGPFVLRPSVVGNPLAQDAVEASVDPAGGLESAGQERGAGRTRTSDRRIMSLTAFVTPRTSGAIPCCIVRLEGAVSGPS